MKRPLGFAACLFLLFFCFAPASFAQVELFGGYSYLRLAPAGATGQNANGWEAGLSAHLLGPLGVEADYSNHYGASSTATVAPGFTELYGPRVQLFSLPRIEPFVHGLFGTVHGVQRFPLGAPCTVGVPCPTRAVSENAFGMAFGGGLNVKATHHVWIRLFQVDYLRAEFNNSPQNEVRFSAGLVLRFGRW